LVGFGKIVRDVTTQKEQAEMLERVSDQMGTLVREIHHRVKNNLQLIISLLSLQAANMTAAESLAAFEAAEARVRAIAHVHERLYASDDFREVEFASYLVNLTHELAQLQATNSPRPDIQMDARDMVLPIDQAVPLGLIANELISNSLKYGVGERAERLFVSLHYLRETFQSEPGETGDDVWAELQVRDQGPGLPSGTDFSTATSLGFRLVHLLSRQLQGTVTVGSGPGADIAVRFPINV
ncbi:MAG TPA: sensor histidine kinase, partial [Bryobacteraceae bacterium]|nr:sensor histidine kinase [Bryobacteraceae bacterium]